MKIKKLLTAAAMVGFLSSTAIAEDKIITIDGSSTVYPITEAVAEEFQTQNSDNVKVTVGISGTGGGFKKFCRGETDISNASRPIKASEMEEAKKNGVEFIELPVGYDAITVMVNPKNTWATTLTVAELKKIWEPAAQGKIMTWDQVRPGFPKQPIKLYGPGADSGTFDYFTEAIVGESKASRGDFTASEDDNVLVQGIANDINALGYFGFAYYLENKDKLKAVAIDTGKGGVMPSEETVKNASYSPLSRPVFIYVSTKALEKPEVKKFTHFYLENAPRLVSEVKYVALPTTVYTQGLARVEELKKGTAFAGKGDVGTPIEEIMKKPLS